MSEDKRENIQVTELKDDELEHVSGGDKRPVDPRPYHGQVRDDEGSLSNYKKK